MIFKLHKPIAQGPRVFTELAFREPAARELVKLSAKPPAEPFEAALAVISLLTGLEADFLERSLSPRDFYELSEVAAQFFAGMEA
ncbi:MAG: Phage tail assembly chaperone protein or 41 or 14 [Pseudomonadota bacterium]|jgi:hypothetical protein